jgi:hypothetical protein
MATHEPSSAWKQSQPTTVGVHSLWTAARANLVTELARLLDAGVPIDERDHRGYAPLMIAAHAGHLEAVDALLARGADPNTTDLFGNTVLLVAAFKGHAAVALRLLESGADLAATNYGGLEARGVALAFGHREVFMLLNRYAQPGGRDGDEDAVDPYADLLRL